MKFNFRLSDHTISGFAGEALEGSQTELSGGSGKGLPAGLKVLNVVSNGQLVTGLNDKKYLQSIISQVL
ncbi:hypothetical protein CS542_07690 [Pedobacter sp. IW39]|nr:hypothetical protein CS542_07690 [Pedobacter sp. IW39]